MTYTATVTREDGTWIAEVQGLTGAHTFAGNLPALQHNLQEVIGLVLDAPEDEVFDVALVFEGVPADFAAAVELGEQRHRLEEQQQQLSEATVATASRLASEGWSVRDIAAALGITPAWVSRVTKAA